MKISSHYFNSDGIEIAMGDKTWENILDDNPLRDRTAKFQIYRTSRIAAGEPFI